MSTMLWDLFFFFLYSSVSILLSDDYIYWELDWWLLGMMTNKQSCAAYCRVICSLLHSVTFNLYAPLNSGYGFLVSKRKREKTTQQDHEKVIHTNLWLYLENIQAGGEGTTKVLTLSCSKFYNGVFSLEFVEKFSRNFFLLLHISSHKNLKKI